MADLEQQYSPSSVAGGSSAPWEAQYRRRSAAARDEVGERLVELPGGSLLVEPPGGGRGGAPLLVFVHGGYWQALRAADSLFPASDLVRQGWGYVALEYPLAPAVSIETMIGECAAMLARLPIAGRRTVLVGHSAGAHLVAAVALSQRPPAVVDRIVLVSGVYDLRELVDTSINDALGLDRERATALSPALATARPHPDVVVTWGEIETETFERQSRSYAAHLRRHGSTVTELRCAGRNHFDILFDLAEPSTPLGRRVLGDGDVSVPPGPRQEDARPAGVSDRRGPGGGAAAPR